MDGVQKELDRLKKKAPGIAGPSTSSKAAALNPTIHDSLDRLIAHLERARGALPSSSDSASSSSQSTAQTRMELSRALERTQREVSERQKEYHAALARLGKALDRKFPTNLAGVADPSLFTSPAAQGALERTVLDHLLRAGEWDAAAAFAKESGIPVPPHIRATFGSLHATIEALEGGRSAPAIAWARQEREFLRARGSPLEYLLHRSQFVRIATGASADVDDDEDSTTEAMAVAEEARKHSMAVDGGSAPRAGATAMEANGARQMGTNVERALIYGRKNFRPFLSEHLSEIQRLFALLLFLPALPPSSDGVPLTPPDLGTLAAGVPKPYRGLLDESAIHACALVPILRGEFCARAGVAREPPLRVGVEVGAGGALSRIVKVREIMKERGNEWSQADELPVEIPLPPHLRFHSIFACPVSKEQATDENPPMMMACGHVVAAESLGRLGKGSGRVKCPYCPIESTISQAIRVHF